MKREIKFRAWDTLNKQMYTRPFIIDPAGRVFFHYDGGGQIQKHLELMQYIGLKDKHGKEIYEGDMFLCHYAKDGCKEQPMVVVYDKDRFTFKRRGICQQRQVTQSLYDHEGWRGEIIGNIYETPHLLT